MLSAHATLTAAAARHDRPSIPPLVGVRLERPAVAVATALTRPSPPERQTEMLLMHEALARAQCSDLYAEAHAARVRQRRLRAARAHRQLEIALRKAERAAREAERRDALCEATG